MDPPREWPTAWNLLVGHCFLKEVREETLLERENARGAEVSREVGGLGVV